MNIDNTKYITFDEASEILEMVGSYSVRIKAINLLNIRTIPADRNKKLYSKEDLEKARTDILNFFEEYCTPDEYNLKSSTLQKRKLDSIPMPNGFNLMFYRRRYGDKPLTIHKNCYLRKDILNIIGTDNKDFTNKDYISVEDTIKLLGMESLSKHTQNQALNSLELQKFKVNLGQGLKPCYSKYEVENTVVKIRDFFSKYCSVGESLVPSYIIASNLASISMPKGYNQAFYKERTNNDKYITYLVAYNKKEVQELEYKYGIENADIIEANIKENTEYLSFTEAQEMLDCSRLIFKKLREELNLREIRQGNNIYLKKQDCIDILRKREEFLSEYIDSVSIKDNYLNGKDHRIITKNIESFPAPVYALTTKNTSAFSLSGAFKIKDVEDFLKNREQTKIKSSQDLISISKENGKMKRNIISINNKDEKIYMSDVNADTPYETFKMRLSMFFDLGNIEETSKYTFSEWHKYVKIKLGKSNCSKPIMSSKINDFTQTTLLLKEILEQNNKTELYMLTSSEINLFQKSIGSLAHRRYFYHFIKYMYQEIINTEGRTKIAYKLVTIEKPPRVSNNKDSKDEIYSFEVYSEVFKYHLDLKYHTEKSIEEIINNRTSTYVSTWLYSMMHLNNAWRNGDISDFPVIDIDDLLVSFEINNLDWFKENILSLEKARGIISRIIQYEISISKTKMDGHFFCGDELAPSLATAIIILTLFKKEYEHIDSNNLINFRTKHNKISKKLLNLFFENLKIDKFEFKSKKFNKTVMTYITYLANLSGDNKSLEYAKYMRSHNNISSTLHYIDFDIKSVEKLSEMLFARGEFGYVTSLLLNKLNGGEVLSFEESTEQIYLVNEMFGDVSKISTTVGFLNTIRGDRVSVAKYISERSFSECQEILTDLFARKLPSKEGTDVQCLFSKIGCQKTNLKSCFECPYHIPTIYALSSLCKTLINDIQRYNDTKNIPNRYRIALSIHKKKFDLSEAVKKFGSEYVFNCLGIDKETFIEILSEIPNPLELSN